MYETLKAPYPWFGGKASVTPYVWSRFGEVRNYVEPFLGSLAMLLGRPGPWSGTETINDLDSFISNFWRAIKADPDSVARHADWPVNECDLLARHSWLVGQRESLTARLESDPEWYDAKAAGWWVWGQCCWIGSGWCSGKGPWQLVDGRLVDVRTLPKEAKQPSGPGVSRKRPNLGNAGKGVNRQLPHLGDAGNGVALRMYLQALSDRMRHVRVCCGDWSRVCGDTPTTGLGLTAVFLDPPYAAEAGRDPSLYAEESATVAHDARKWAVERGDDPRIRICLAGYESEHEMPRSWSCVAWKSKGGYGSQAKDHDNPNARRERLWFSRHCLPAPS